MRREKRNISSSRFALPGPLAKLLGLERNGMLKAIKVKHDLDLPLVATLRRVCLLACRMLLWKLQLSVCVEIEIIKTNKR